MKASLGPSLLNTSMLPAPLARGYLAVRQPSLNSLHSGTERLTGPHSRPACASKPLAARSLRPSSIAQTPFSQALVLHAGDAPSHAVPGLLSCAVCKQHGEFFIKPTEVPACDSLHVGFNTVVLNFMAHTQQRCIPAVVHSQAAHAGHQGRRLLVLDERL